MPTPHCATTPPQNIVRARHHARLFTIIILPANTTNTPMPMSATVPGAIASRIPRRACLIRHHEQPFITLVNYAPYMKDHAVYLIQRGVARLCATTNISRAKQHIIFAINIIACTLSRHSCSFVTTVMTPVKANTTPSINVMVPSRMHVRRRRNIAPNTLFAALFTPWYRARHTPVGCLRVTTSAWRHHATPLRRRKTQTEYAEESLPFTPLSHILISAHA